MPRKKAQAKPCVSPALTRVYAWFSALIADDTALMEDLLAHGLPVDVPHPLRHTTALMEATRLGRTALVSWLLGRGATPAFLCGLPRGTPLHCALSLQHWDIAEQLLAAGAQCQVVDGYNRTPLHTLAMEMPEDQLSLRRALIIADKLLEKGCVLDALDQEGITALHYCVINDYAPLAHLLLERGANPNTQTPDTQVSPLTIAALEKNVTLAHLLLQYGANPNAATKEGSTPYTIMPSLKRIAAQAALGVDSDLTGQPLPATTARRTLN